MVAFVDNKSYSEDNKVTSFLRHTYSLHYVCQYEYSLHVNCTHTDIRNVNCTQLCSVRYRAYTVYTIDQLLLQLH